MPDTHCATRRARGSKPPNRRAMIFSRLGHRAVFPFVFREAGRSTTTMSADRSTSSLRAVLFLFALLGIPCGARSSTLEESAKELAQKIVPALPAGENVSCEIRNISSLKPGEAARVEQTLKAELQDRGVHLARGAAAISLVVTLSENFKSFVWTGEIRQGETSQVVFVSLDRFAQNRAISSAMLVTIRSEKFWEGPQRILDAGEISNGAGKSWLVLLLPDSLIIQDKQTGLVNKLEIASNQGVSRDPWGNLSLVPVGDTIAFFLAPRVCSVNLESPNLNGCLAGEGSAGAPLGSRSALMFDVSPPGPPPPGKGTEIEMKSACGGANQILASGARDYTQPDSLQVFQMDLSGAVAVSSELDFPGPITAVHAVSDPPTAIVRNLTTGNYEAYRLSFSCGQ
jgi:hypothetical protein